MYPKPKYYLGLFFACTPPQAGTGRTGIIGTGITAQNSADSTANVIRYDDNMFHANVSRMVDYSTAMVFQHFQAFSARFSCIIIIILLKEYIYK